MARILIAAALALSAVATPALAGDAAAGKAYFKSTCAMCHGDTATSSPGIGPRLFGVVGRKAGSFAGYHYSPAMAAAGFTWTPSQLQTYLISPQTMVKGNKMPFTGVADPRKREDVVAYLATLH